MLAGVTSRFHGELKETTRSRITPRALPVHTGLGFLRDQRVVVFRLRLAELDPVHHPGPVAFQALLLGALILQTLVIFPFRKNVPVNVVVIVKNLVKRSVTSDGRPSLSVRKRSSLPGTRLTAPSRSFDSGINTGTSGFWIRKSVPCPCA